MIRKYVFIASQIPFKPPPPRSFSVANLQLNLLRPSMLVAKITAIESLPEYRRNHKSPLSRTIEGNFRFIHSLCDDDSLCGPNVARLAQTPRPKVDRESKPLRFRVSFNRIWLEPVPSISAIRFSSSVDGESPYYVCTHFVCLLSITHKAFTLFPKHIYYNEIGRYSAAICWRRLQKVETED